VYIEGCSEMLKGRLYKRCSECSKDCIECILRVILRILVSVV
jgi:hypothetical protein